MKLTQQEKTRLRALAQRYAAAASLPEQGVRRSGWERFNTMERERPRVLIDQIPWNELNVDGCLDNQVTEPYWQGVETWLLREMYKAGELEYAEALA